MPLQLCLFSLPPSLPDPDQVFLPPGSSLSVTCHKACGAAVKGFCFLVFFSPWKTLDPGHTVCEEPKVRACFAWWIIRHSLWITHFAFSAALKLQPLSDGCFNLRYWWFEGSNHFQHLLNLHDEVSYTQRERVAPFSVYLQPVYYYLWPYCSCSKHSARSSSPFAFCFWKISCFWTPPWDLSSLLKQPVWKTGAWHCFPSVAVTTCCFLFSWSPCRCSLHHLLLSCHKGFQAAPPDGFQWLDRNMSERWEHPGSNITAKRNNPASIFLWFENCTQLNNPGLLLWNEKA